MRPHVAPSLSHVFIIGHGSVPHLPGPTSAPPQWGFSGGHSPQDRTSLQPSGMSPQSTSSASQLVGSQIAPVPPSPPLPPPVPPAPSEICVTSSMPSTDAHAAPLPA